MSNPLYPYDAVLVCSYGGPRKMEDVLPFMRNATSGRGVPDSRLEAVSHHYKGFAGVSPINARNNDIVQALRWELADRGSRIPVAIGNRNWSPFFRDTLTDMYQQGARHVLALFTSAYVSYSGCRQYREDLARALTQMEDQGMTGMTIDKARAYYTTDGFVQANVDAIVQAFGAEADKGHHGDNQTLLFVTHSIPTPMYRASGPRDGSRPDYAQQHRNICAVVVDEVEAALGRDIDWELSYCSRSGPPHQPWLEPDVNDSLHTLATQGVTSVVCSPIGFINDHMEVVYDLDTEAAQTAAECGISYTRAATVGDDARFVASLADVLCERAAQARGELPDLPAGLGVGRCDNADSVATDALTAQVDVMSGDGVAQGGADSTGGASDGSGDGTGDHEAADAVDPQWRGFTAKDVVKPTWPAVSPVGDSTNSPDADFQPTIAGG